nr:hypothetical protein [Micromonospora sp. DSM 115978]
MAFLRRWSAGLGAVLTAVSLAVFVPVAAWASSGTGEMVVEAARRRPRGGFGIFGALCCLVVIGVIVLIVLLIMRGRRSGRR